MAAKSKRPYLLRALFDWIVDSGLTPYLLVAADAPAVRVPEQHVHDGKIVLNISPNAVRNLAVTDDLVSFDGRFDGAPFWVEMPVAHVQAIYAKESGEGMMFDPDPDGLLASEASDKQDEGDTVTKMPSGPNLKVIK